MNIELTLDEYESDFVSWNDLSEKDRGFFCDDAYLPLHENIASRIFLLKGTSRPDRFSRMMLRGLPYPLEDTSSKYPIYESIHTEKAWNDEAESVLVRKWLHDLKIPYSTTIYLLNDKVVRTDWKTFIKYWDAFSWLSSYEMIIVDGTNQWAVKVFHECYIYYYGFE